MIKSLSATLWIEKPKGWSRWGPHDHVFVNGEKVQLAQGSSNRAAYNYAGLRIKTDSDIEQTSTEISLWKSFEEEDKQFFLGLIGWGRMTDGSPWLAQELVRDKEWGSATQEHMDNLTRVIEKYGIEDCYAGYNEQYDYASMLNCGVAKGRPVIFDWGY